MGDRCQVTLTLPLSLEKLAQSHSEWESWAPFHSFSGDFLIEYAFDEVNYGDLKIANLLATELGIPCYYRWEAGGSYGPGTQYYWFTENGELRGLQVYDEEINPDLAKLMKLIDKPTELRQYILDHFNNQQVPELSEQQIEYGKKYRVRRLITQ